MGDCYLCGDKLIDTPIDYLQNREKYKNSAIKHDEHIIQNSLYGRLTSDNILCEACGSKLSTIDSDFCKIFESLTERIKHILASKDHGNSDFKRTLKGFIFKKDGTKIPVHVKEGKVTPEKPYYDFIKDQNRVEIYSTKAVGKEIKNKALKELAAKGIDTRLIEFIVIDDISDAGSLGVNFSEGIENFNEKFQLGLNKIATGFALSNGVSRMDVPRTLDTKNKKLKLSDNIIPFRAHAPFDILVEPFRVLMEDDFPTHTLLLYTDDSDGQQLLVCYIDLFSTFQYYVILNENYLGPPINQTYYQTILKQTKPDLNIRHTRWKYLPLVADEIGVKREELAGKTIDEMYDLLEKRYKQFTVGYKKNIKDYLHRISSLASLKLTLAKGKLSQHLTEEEKEIVEALPDFEPHHLLCISKELQSIEEDEELNYRRQFIGANKKGGLFIFSTLHAMMGIAQAGLDSFEIYGHHKFYQLSQFIKGNEKKEI